jgi:hypothetical protein
VVDTLREHLRKAGAIGGKAKGKAKARGDADYYRKLAKKSAKARKDKASDSGTVTKGK